MHSAFVNGSSFLRSTALEDIIDFEAVAKELAHARRERQTDDDDRAHSFE
jgi:hypothetical protein